MPHADARPSVMLSSRLRMVKVGIRDFSVFNAFIESMLFCILASNRFGRARDRLTAIIRGAGERLIPILINRLATALALIPLALSTGEPGSEIQAPMAIFCGLLTSTGLNRVVVPALYLRFGAVSRTFTGVS